MEPGKLEALVEGDIEKVERTMKITEIRVRYKLPIPGDMQETAERVMRVHPAGCPAYQSLKEAIRFQIDVEFDLK